MKHTFRTFTKIARMWSAFLAVVATAGITNISAARADATDAKNLLKAMSDYLAAQKAISFDYDVNLEGVLAPTLLGGHRVHCSKLRPC